MQFKKTGYDVMIVRGRAEKPVWIEIKNGEILYHDAGELWGMHVFALTEKLGQDNNRRNVLCIRFWKLNSIVYEIAGKKLLAPF